MKKKKSSRIMETKMEFEEEKLPEIVTTPPPGLKKGDLIFILDGYDLMKGKVLSIGKKNIKAEIQSFGPGTYEKYVPFDKVALPDENICIVWQRWKGVEGTYRIERKLYSQYQTMAKNWPHQAMVREHKYGEIDNYYPGMSQQKIKDFLDFLDSL